MTGRSLRSDEAEAEAALWLARLHADTRSPADDAAFRRWVDAAPENEAAFRELTAIWDAAGGVSRERFAPARRGVPLPSRRAMLVGASAAIVAGIGFGGWQRAYAGVYETDFGEQKHVALDDGSLVFLDTDSRIRLQFGTDARRVALQRGRANFRVAANAARPFIVEAGEQRVVTPQAVFDVRRDESRLAVTVIDGQASVQPLGGGATAAGSTLSAGERWVIGRDRPGLIDRPDMVQQLAWQNGQMIADDQSLAAVVAEMNRYSRTKLAIGDARAASLRLSGVYRVGDNVAFARAVSRLLPVGIRNTSNGIEFFSISSQAVTISAH